MTSGLSATHLADGVGASGGLSDVLEVVEGQQERREPAPDDRLVVDDHHPDGILSGYALPLRSSTVASRDVVTVYARTCAQTNGQHGVPAQLARATARSLASRKSTPPAGVPATALL